MARSGIMDAFFAFVVVTLLSSVLSLSVSDKYASPENIEGLLDQYESNFQNAESPVMKRSVEAHHIAKRDASSRVISKRQVLGRSRLEKLFLNTLLTFLEAYQAFDTDVMDELTPLIDRMNATIRAGGAPPETVSAFASSVEEIKAKVSRNSVLPKNCGKDPLNSREPLKGNHPWAVAVGTLATGNGKNLIGCIGIIISPYHVLASVPCVVTDKWTNVFAGDNNHVIAHRWIHTSIKEAEDINEGHNIGILMVETPFRFDAKLQPACVPSYFDTLDANSQSRSTLVGLEESPTGLRQYSWQGSTTMGPKLCYELLKNDGSINKNIFTDIITVFHFCVLRPFDEADISVVVQQVSGPGRVQAMGVGPVADPKTQTPILYTQVQTHNFWIELMVKNSIALLA